MHKISAFLSIFVQNQYNKTIRIRDEFFVLGEVIIKNNIQPFEYDRQTINLLIHEFCLYV